jgi:hypothetical protein
LITGLSEFLTTKAKKAQKEGKKKEKPTYSIPYSPFRPACGPRGEFLAICGPPHGRGYPGSPAGIEALSLSMGGYPG